MNHRFHGLPRISWSAFPGRLLSNGRIVEEASRRLLEESQRLLDADSTFCHSPALVAAFPSKLARSTSSAPVIRSNVSMVGSLSRFSTRETIVWLSPDRVATSFKESFRRSRSSRSNSINRPITASRSDAFDTPASYATDSLTRDVTIGTRDCASRTGI